MSKRKQISVKSLPERLEKLSKRARGEFDDISDFIWKSPTLIEHQRNIEIAKLKAYFAEGSKLREIRWNRESHKLNQTFPYLIAVGNLFSALSIFESYLLLLASEMQPHTPVALQSVKGQGINRLFTFFKLTGISTDCIPLHEQVQAGIKIRNCVAHASGMLDWSRQNEDLRRIRSSGAYLSPEDRRRHVKQGRKYDEIRIGPSELGDRLMVDNIYCHVLCSYLRDYFSNLCEAASVVLQAQTQKPSIARDLKQ